MKTQSSENELTVLRRRARFARVLGALGGAAITVLAGYLALLQVGGALVSLSYDLPFIAHRSGGGGDLRVVYFDEMAGDRLDRSFQKSLLDALNEAGARAVVYDVLFDQPWSDPEVDQDFAAAIRRFRGVDDEGQAILGSPQRPVLLAFGRESISQAGASGEQLIPAIDILLDAAEGYGLAAYVPGERSTVRILSTGTTDEPSLAWNAAIALGAKLDEEERLESRWINYAGPPPDRSGSGSEPAIRSCTAGDVLGAEPGFFRNKIVVIGGKPGIAGPGVDSFATPFHLFQQRGSLPLMAGVDLQANVLANLIKGNWLTRSSGRFDRYFIIAIGVLAGVGCALLRPVPATVLAVGVVVLLILAGILVMHYNRVWFPWSVPALLQIPVALVLGISTNFCVERWSHQTLAEQQRRLRDAFALYLSPQMLDRLAKDDFILKLRGQQADVAMMMTDLATYSSMCERVKDPEQIVKVLQDYFKRVTKPIFQHQGLILQFVGDGMFAAWGTPLATPHPDPEACLNAVRAAWELSQIDRMSVDAVEMQTRVGLNFGGVLAGNIGGDEHLAYSLTGDSVNLTSRLEGLNKHLGTSILMSQAVYDHPEVQKEFRTRRVGKFQVKGRKEVTDVYELLGPVVEAHEPEWISLYHDALKAMEAGDLEVAREGFKSADVVRSSRGAETRAKVGDGPSNFFLDLLDRGESLTSGVVVLNEK